MDLLQMSRLPVDPANRIEFHPVFVGARERRDAWQMTRWKPLGGHHVLLAITSGTIRFRIGSRTWLLGPDTAFLISPEARPDVAFSSIVRYHEVYFSPFRKRRPVALEPSCLILEKDGGLPPICDRIASELRDGHPEHIQVARYYLGIALTLFHRRLTLPQGRRLSVGQRARVMEFALKNLAAHPSPADLARVAGLSVDYFSRLFQSTFGLAPRDWLVRERMREASRLLSDSNDPVYRIAESLGYEDTPHFCRQFRATIGVTPGQWRAQA